MQARFFDGITAKAHKVTLQLSSSHIVIIADRKAFELRWHYEDLRVVSAQRLAVPGKISSVKSPDARLLIDDEKVWKAITARLSPKQGAERITASWGTIAGLTAGLAAMAVLLVLYFPRFMGASGALVPESWMDRLGRDALTAMVTEPVCTDPDGVAALGAMIARLEPGIAEVGSYRVLVAQDDDIINAFAFPGRYIVIYSGLIKNAGTADEVAGVLAHETGHLALGHARKRLMRSVGVSVITRMIFDSQTLADLTTVASELSFSRKEEHEADAFAAGALSSAALSVKGLAGFLEKQMAESGEAETPKFLTFFSTHPASEERAARLLALGESAPSDTPPALTRQQWQSLRNICGETRPLSAVLPAE